jgi:hypothetical protein
VEKAPPSIGEGGDGVFRITQRIGIVPPAPPPPHTT